MNTDESGGSDTDAESSEGGTGIGSENLNSEISETQDSHAEN